jgi:hypothetical protein
MQISRMLNQKNFNQYVEENDSDYFSGNESDEENKIGNKTIIQEKK